MSSFRELKNRLGNSSHIFDLFKLDNTNRLCVYAWVREDEVLYIGLTDRPLVRALRHHVIQKVEKILPGDKLVIWFCNDSASLIESDVISLLAPVYNANNTKNRRSERLEDRRCWNCGEKFTATKWWQNFCNGSCRSAAHASKTHQNTDGPLLPIEFIGICLNPSCRAIFRTMRRVQRFCKEECRRIYHKELERRKLGNKDMVE